MQTLILRIEELDAGRGGYPLRLLRWPAELLAEEVIPQSLQLAGMAGPFVEAQLRDTFLGATGPEPALRQIGAQLYALVVQGAIGGSLNGAGGQRVVLEVRPGGLRDLPWELLWRTDQAPGFGDEARPFSRGELSDEPLAPQEWPLRILIAVGSAADDPAVRAEQ